MFKFKSKFKSKFKKWSSISYSRFYDKFDSYIETLGYDVNSGRDKPYYEWNYVVNYFFWDSCFLKWLKVTLNESKIWNFILNDLKLLKFYNAVVSMPLIKLLLEPVVYIFSWIKFFINFALSLSQAAWVLETEQREVAKLLELRKLDPNVPITVLDHIKLIPSKIKNSWCIYKNSSWWYVIYLDNLKFWDGIYSSNVFDIYNCIYLKLNEFLNLLYDIFVVTYIKRFHKNLMFISNKVMFARSSASRPVYYLVAMFDLFRRLILFLYLIVYIHYFVYASVVLFLLFLPLEVFVESYCLVWFNKSFFKWFRFVLLCFKFLLLNWCGLKLLAEFLLSKFDTFFLWIFRLKWNFKVIIRRWFVPFWVLLLNILWFSELSKQAKLYHIRFYFYSRIKYRCYKWWKYVIWALFIFVYWLIRKLFLLFLSLIRNLILKYYPQVKFRYKEGMVLKRLKASFWIFFIYLKYYLKVLGVKFVLFLKLFRFAVYKFYLILKFIIFRPHYVLLYLFYILLLVFYYFLLGLWFLITTFFFPIFLLFFKLFYKLYKFFIKLFFFLFLEPFILTINNFKHNNSKLYYKFKGSFLKDFIYKFDFCRIFFSDKVKEKTKCKIEDTVDLLLSLSDRSNEYLYKNYNNYNALVVNPDTVRSNFLEPQTYFYFKNYLNKNNEFFYDLFMLKVKKKYVGFGKSFSVFKSNVDYVGFVTVNSLEFKRYPERFYNKLFLQVIWDTDLPLLIQQVNKEKDLYLEKPEYRHGLMLLKKQSELFFIWDMYVKIALFDKNVREEDLKKWWRRRYKTESFESNLLKQSRERAALFSQIEDSRNRIWELEKNFAVRLKFCYDSFHSFSKFSFPVFFDLIKNYKFKFWWVEVFFFKDKRLGFYKRDLNVTGKREQTYYILFTMIEYKRKVFFLASDFLDDFFKKKKQ